MLSKYMRMFFHLWSFSLSRCYKAILDIGCPKQFLICFGEVGSIYTYCLGLFYWYLDNNTVAAVPVEQPLRIWYNS